MKNIHSKQETVLNRALNIGGGNILTEEGEVALNRIFDAVEAVRVKWNLPEYRGASLSQNGSTWLPEYGDENSFKGESVLAGLKVCIDELENRLVAFGILEEKNESDNLFVKIVTIGNEINSCRRVIESKRQEWLIWDNSRRSYDWSFTAEKDPNTIKYRIFDLFDFTWFDAIFNSLMPLVVTDKLSKADKGAVFDIVDTFINYRDIVLGLYPESALDADKAKKAFANMKKAADSRLVATENSRKNRGEDKEKWKAEAKRIILEYHSESEVLSLKQNILRRTIRGKWSKSEISRPDSDSELNKPINELKDEIRKK